MIATKYQELEIWKEGIDLCEKIYRTTEEFPRREHFGISSQMRRASLSVPSNIAEGFVRKHPKEFKHFLSISLASIAELETQLLLSSRLGYLSQAILDEILVSCERISKRTTCLYQKLR